MDLRIKTTDGVKETRVRAVQADIDRMVGLGAAGAIATITEDGATVTLTSGVADRDSKTKIPTAPQQRVRAGSITKTFTSVVLLQLVSEGKVSLDEPVETYLPGLLRGDGIDGHAITVRQLMRHQSGLPDFAANPEVNEYLAGVEKRTATPAEEVAIALRRPADFAPGSRYAYSNTNYIVVGMLIERVTGKPFGDELQRRVITPLGLQDTYLPATGELDIRGPHPEGYATIAGTVTDVSRVEPSVPWAAGSIVSTGVDLNRFYAAVVAGQVVKARELEQMLAGVPTGPDPGLTYGLGIGSTTLPCGAEYIGHTGGIYGFFTISGVTRDKRAVTLTFTKETTEKPDVSGMLSHALCPQPT
ncbi:D-alanyl-D-alanine carboxypeptidase [Actinocrispum wychmicini]|uniref:D-alanyl-D-alanine carboxypeptidase n=2 Tax=Actinocrispum wychmicini TaxID=1213861 RepID=A0A4R2K059_9PSEU|nr:D-alanyl-D-alanine carboxypeptidase [Actinocrispum wychmicini]